MLLEPVSTHRLRLLLPGCELRERDEWPNWDLLEGIVNGEGAPG